MHRFSSVLLCVVVVCAIQGCSGPGGTGPSDPDGSAPLDYIYVDGACVGPEDGTQAHPYDTIIEAVAAAGDGTLVVIAAGDYALGGDLLLTKAVSFRGAGVDSTSLDGFIRVNAFSDSFSCRFSSMAFGGATFADACANGPVPIVIDSCHVSGAAITEPPDHSYSLLNSVLDGGAAFADAGGTAINVIRNCIVGGPIGYAQGSGDITNVIEDSQINGSVVITSFDGTALTIRRNTISGQFDDRSGSWYTIITDNVIGGGIDDRSGGIGDGTEDCIVERNVITGGVNASCASMSFRENVVTYGTFGFMGTCGDPTHITGNTFTRQAAYADSAGFGLVLAIGSGAVSDNDIEGATYGIYGWCSGTTFEGNTVAGADTGVVLKGAAAFTGNTINGSASHGLVVLGPLGPISDCTITGNGGAGVLLKSPADLGGGAGGSIGGNLLTGNGEYDVRVACPAESAAVIYARWNTWDHGDSASIREFDIYDGMDDPSLGVVDFGSIGGRNRGQPN